MTDRRDERPDPDALLAQISDDETRAARGHLKVFFGASPGVGKTYAMLAEARRLREEGRDVVVGVVETHGRGDTARLIAGLEVLPRVKFEYRDRTLEEFDLDAALARKPAVLLVDELAHTNAPGSRHPKRYQDVLELLAAGIDVYTTVNVQHIESLNDIVGGITGIKVRETLPDRVFDQADEVMLVDLPPDDLLQRLREGKVYLRRAGRARGAELLPQGQPARAARARAAAHRGPRRHADAELPRASTSRARRSWQARDALLVGVGPRGGDEAVVRAAARLASALDARWHAVYVETPALAGLSDARRRTVLATLKLAQELGAQTATVVGADDRRRARRVRARMHNLGTLVLGRGTAPRRLLHRWRGDLAARGSARLRRTST